MFTSTFLDAVRKSDLWQRKWTEVNISENSPDLLDLLTFASGSSYIDMYLFGLLEFYLFYILCISVKNQQQKLPTEQVIPKDIR